MKTVRQAAGRTCEHYTAGDRGDCGRPAVGSVNGKSAGLPGAFWHCERHSIAMRLWIGMDLARAVEHHRIALKRRKAAAAA